MNRIEDTVMECTENCGAILEQTSETLRGNPWECGKKTMPAFRFSSVTPTCLDVEEGWWKPWTLKEEFILMEVEQ